MHNRLHHFHRFAAIFAVGAIGMSFAAFICNVDSDRTPVPSTRVASKHGELLREPWPAGQPVVQSPWVQARLAAVKQIYGFTVTGESWIDGYDFRQMPDQPAWFGSNGYASWAGAGEATPRSILHELGHSYWGAFAVDRHPELTWESEAGTSPALQAYRDDLRAFITQPPDRFEPLRDRLRNLPNLDVGDYPDLFHFGEADLLYMTGGNLELVPPILRKYVSRYVAPGGVGPASGGMLDSWDVAMAWFSELSDENRRVAGEVFGLQHFPAEPYIDLPKTALFGLDIGIRTVYAEEERQRLIDFAEQFDGVIGREFWLVDAAGADRGFDFWRSYLSDKLELHGRYPDVLRRVHTERATQLAAALDFYRSIAGLSSETQVNQFDDHRDQPLVPELAVLLTPRAIVQLFAENSAADPDGIATVLGERAERLAGLLDAVSRVESAQSTASAAFEFELFITSVPEDQLRSDIYLLLGLLRSTSDGGLAKRVLPALSDDALQLLIRVAPAVARSAEIGPERLLKAVGITETASLAQVRAGAEVLAANSSGNFAIDAPYDAAIYAHLDRFAEIAPADVLSTLTDTGMRVIPWISRGGDVADVVLGANPSASAAALLRLTGSNETPWRILHMLAKTDPALAASITVEMSRQSTEDSDVLVKMLREFVYDSYWWQRRAGPNVHPVQFAKFLAAMLDAAGEPATIAALESVKLQIEHETAAGVIETGADLALRNTVQDALENTTGDIDARVRPILAFVDLIE